MPAKLTHAQLAKLSGLSRAKLDEFGHTWRDLPLLERRRVVKTLAQLAEENVELEFHDLFLRLLSDADAEVRASAIDGLWEDERPSTADALIKVTREDEDSAVRANALKALGRFAYRIALGELHPATAARVRDALIAHTDATEAAIRRRAVESVGYLADEAVRGIIREAYASTDPGLRASAVHAMGRSCDVMWLNTVLREVESDDPEMRFEAAQAAGEIGDERAAPALIVATGDDDADARLAAVAALGAVGGAAAKQALGQIARGDDEAMAEAASLALDELNAAADPLGVRVTNISPN